MASGATEVASGIAGFALVDGEPIIVLFHTNLLSVDEGEDESYGAHHDTGNNHAN